MQSRILLLLSLVLSPGLLCGNANAQADDGRRTVNAASAPVSAPWPIPSGVRTVSINGYPMAYIERGSGPVVVFVHGSGIDYRYFESQVEKFGDRYRAIAVSLRHYYPEPWRGDGDFSLSQHAADLVAFVRDLGAGPVHLVAHSRGANVALRATVSAPEIVRSLVLAEGGGPMAGLADAGPGRRGAGGAVLRGIAEKIANGQTDAGLQAFIEFLNGPGAWDALPDLGRRVLRDNAATLPANEIDLARLPPLTCDEVRRLDVPVLLMGGTLSPPAFGAVLDRLQGCLSRFERVRIEGAGHGMARSHASVFDTAVMTFIDSRSPHGAR